MWHQLDGTLTGLRLECEGNIKATLKIGGLFTLGSFSGTTPTIYIGFKTKTIWSSLTYRTVITNSATGEILGEYTTSHSRNGVLALKGHDYILSLDMDNTNH